MDKESIHKRKYLLGLSFNITFHMSVLICIIKEITKVLQIKPCTVTSGNALFCLIFIFFSLGKKMLEEKLVCPLVY